MDMRLSFLDSEPDPDFLESGIAPSAFLDMDKFLFEKDSELTVFGHSPVDMDFDEYDDPKRRDMLAVIWRSHSMILKCIPSFSERTVCIIAEYAWRIVDVEISVDEYSGVSHLYGFKREDFVTKLNSLKSLPFFDCVQGVLVDWVDFRKFQLDARDWNRITFGSRLRHLILDDSNIRNVDFRCTNVEKMSFKRMHHNPEDWLTIMFPDSLRDLDISHTNFCGELSYTKIETLDFSFSTSEYNEVLEFPKSLRKLNLEGAHFQKGSLVGTNIEHLNCKGTIHDNWDGIGIPKTLMTIDLSDTHFKASLAHTRLESVNMCGVVLSTEGFEENENPWSRVGFPKTLKTLNLGDSNFNWNLGDLNIVDLNLWGVKLKDWSFMAFPDTLRDLNLNLSNFFGDLSYTKITHMQMKNVRHDDWIFIKFPKTLETLNLSKSNFNGFLTYLTSLTSLDLSFVNINTWSQVEFPISITYLNLRGSNFDQSLIHMVRLYSLDMSYVQIGSSWKWVHFPQSLRVLNFLQSDFQGDLSYLENMDTIKASDYSKILLPDYVTSHGEGADRKISVAIANRGKNDARISIAVSGPISLSPLKKEFQERQALPGSPQAKCKIATGERVVLEGHPDFHGHRGVVGKFNKKRSRWWVRLDDNRSLLVSEDYMVPLFFAQDAEESEEDKKEIAGEKNGEEGEEEPMIKREPGERVIFHGGEMNKNPEGS